MNGPGKDPPHEDGDGARDREAPVAGARLEVLYDGLPLNNRAKFAKREQKFAKRQQRVSPEARKARRDSIRLGLTALLFAAIVGEFLLALYLTEISKALSWSTVKDWLALSEAPLTAMAALAAAFWWPTRESD